MRDPGDVALFGRITLFALALPLLLRLPLPQLLGLLGAGTRDRVSFEAYKVVSYTRAAIRLFRPLVRRSCTTRALTTFYFLRRAGLEPAIHFGVGTPSGSFAGHCWLSLGGTPILERTDPRGIFTETYVYPAREAGKCT